MPRAEPTAALEGHQRLAVKKGWGETIAAGF